MSLICSIKLLSQGVRIQWQLFPGRCDWAPAPTPARGTGMLESCRLLLPCQGAPQESTKCEVDTLKQVFKHFCWMGLELCCFLLPEPGQRFPAGCFCMSWSRKQLLVCFLSRQRICAWFCLSVHVCGFLCVLQIGREYWLRDFLEVLFLKFCFKMKGSSSLFPIFKPWWFYVLF